MWLAGLHRQIKRGAPRRHGPSSILWVVGSHFLGNAKNVSETVPTSDDDGDDATSRMKSIDVNAYFL